jgi:hypothetical protein
MGPDIKVDLQIPDLWYDFYARLLPGITFVGTIRCCLLGLLNLPSLLEILVIFIIGYIVALITQPLSSRISRWIERLVEKMKNIKENDFIRRVQKELGLDSRPSMVISKMHGEVSFFVQLSMLTLVYLLIQTFVGNKSIISLNWFPILFAVVCVIWAFEVAMRRLQRAIKDGKLAGIKPDETQHPPSESIAD